MKFIIYKDKEEFIQLHTWNEGHHSEHILAKVDKDENFLCSGDFKETKGGIELDNLGFSPYNTLTVNEIEECIFCSLICKQDDIEIGTFIENQRFIVRDFWEAIR